MHSRTLLHFQSKILKRSLVSASGVASSKAYSRGFDSRLRRRDLQRCVFRRRSRRPGREFKRQPSVEVLAHDDEERRIVVAFRRPGQVSSCGVWTRAVASGGAVVPGNPFKICAPISCLAPKLLHTSNIVFLKCAHPLLRNPGDGPGVEKGKLQIDVCDICPSSVESKLQPLAFAVKSTTSWVSVCGILFTCLAYFLKPNRKDLRRYK